jgi:hypothetical protein
MNSERPFCEFLTAAPKPAPSTAPMARSAGRPGRYVAKVAQCDAVNQNARVYPRHVMQREVERLRPLLAHGRVGGAVDHVGFADGGNLKDEALLWRDLRVESDGAVIGEFEILPTARGKDLKTLIDGGRAIGFSTFGFGVSKPADANERRKYGAAADDDEVVVMGDTYRLVSIDAVSDPSVHDAFLYRESRERGGAGRRRAEQLAGIGVEPGATQPKSTPRVTSVFAG